MGVDVDGLRPLWCFCELVGLKEEMGDSQRKQSASICHCSSAVQPKFTHHDLH